MTIDIVEVVSVLLWRPRTQRSVEPLLTVRGIFMYAQSACVNCNDGNQISLPQQSEYATARKIRDKRASGIERLFVGARYGKRGGQVVKKKKKIMALWKFVFGTFSCKRE